MKLKIQKIDAEAVLPKYAIAGDAGLDLYSAEETVIEAGSRCAVKTGIKMKISRGGGMQGLYGIEAVWR